MRIFHWRKARPAGRRLTVSACLALLTATVVWLAPAAPAAAVVDVGGWRASYTVGTEEFDVPSVDDGRMLWAEYGTDTVAGGALHLYDVESTQSRSVPLAGIHPMFPKLDGERAVFQGYSRTGEPTGPDTGIYLYSFAEEKLRKLSADGWQAQAVSTAGDVIAWVENRFDTQGDESLRIMLHRVATDQTTVLVVREREDGGVWVAQVSERWVLVRSLSLATGGPKYHYVAYPTDGTAPKDVDLQGGVAAALDGDALYYTLASPTGASNPTLPAPAPRQELRVRDLANGADALVATSAESIQSVCVDGVRVAWASWDAGGPFIGVLERAAGSPAPDQAGSTFTRLPSPAYQVGNLVLAGDLLLWRGERPFFSPTTSGAYLFAYDFTDETVTRLSPIQTYAHGFDTDGHTVAVCESQREPGSLRVAVSATSRDDSAHVPEFADVIGSHPYRTAVVGLAQMGAVSGYPPVGGLVDFRPDGLLTRGQFAKMLVEALDITVAGDYLNTLVQLGILQGAKDGNLYPYRNVTRAQMITMVVRAVDTLRPDLLASDTPYPKSTLGLFDKTHALNLRRAEWGGLLDGLVGFSATWDPWRLAGRGEAAQVLWNLAGANRAPATGPSRFDEMPVMEPVDLVSRTAAPYVWSPVLADHLVAYVESDTSALPIGGPSASHEGRTAAVRVLPLDEPAGTARTVAGGRIPSPLFENHFSFWPWWFLTGLRGTGGDEEAGSEPRFVWGTGDDRYSGGGICYKKTRWAPGAGNGTGSLPAYDLFSAAQMTLPVIRQGDILAFPLTSPAFENEHLGDTGNTLGEKLMVLTPALAAPVAVDPAAPKLFPAALAGSSPYVSWVTTPRWGNERWRTDLPGRPPEVFDLRTGERVDIIVDDPQEVEYRAASVVGGKWAAWIDRTPFGLYLADLATGHATRLAVDELPTDTIALCDEWLVWLEADPSRESSGTLRGFHLPDLTPFAVSGALGAKEYSYRLQVSSDLVLFDVVKRNPTDFDLMSYTPPPLATAIRAVRLDEAAVLKGGTP